MLPDKPSELILLALADLEKCELDDNYRVNMNVWHEYDYPTSMEHEYKPTCQICLGGAIMAQTLEVSLEECVDPSSFKGDLDPKLRSLNAFREGRLHEALKILSLERYNSSIPRVVPTTSYTTITYGDNRTNFYQCMNNIVEILKRANL